MPRSPIWWKEKRPAYYDLVKFAVKKEAEMKFDEARQNKKDFMSTPKRTTHFRYARKKPRLPATPAVWMVAPVPEEGPGPGEISPPLSKESDSRESYKLVTEDPSISQDDVDIAISVAKATKTFTGCCFWCNKDAHQLWDEEYKIYDPEFLKTSQGPAERLSWQAPRVKGQTKLTGAMATQ